MSGNEAYEVGGLYIILSLLPNDGMHWGLFLMVSPPWGNVYNATDKSGEWVLDEHMTENVIGSQTILGALQIATGIDENQSTTVHNIILGTPVLRQGGFVPQWNENFRCRVWVKDALERLRVAGFIPDCDVQDLEDEADSFGRQTKNIGRRGVVEVSRML
ncbi:hypothetical protein ONS95_010701 [Cadophora gregata]|uniref:uncharacterized protein n=1 Tax=Cadophora gregata TaxID=51156 RepID=UPI0026DCE411|nr:uncharacterized protein ONS95_010701 [Cadophora gregata]KAK0122469.1 hypothetical protein ONS95_010701 [Cadophora gregata]KAK0127946.1 hypothetical protein ONS96_007444 [Cadophora gregata f. sp. sojae]